MKKSIVSLLFIALFAFANAGISTVEVFWTGGWCGVCDGEGNYACSSGGAAWNSGNQVFLDPIPSGNIVTDVYAEVYGVFGCSGHMNLQVRLNDVGIGAVNQQGTNCACGTCDPILATDMYTNSSGVESYNYGGNNLVHLEVHAGEPCVHKVAIYLTWQSGNTGPGWIPECEGGCGQHGECEADMETMTANCECDVEFYGPNCQCFVPSEMLSTDHPPVLDVSNSGFQEKDTLYLAVNNSVKYFDTKITFKNAVNNTCDYPQVSDSISWTKGFAYETCQNQYQGIVPWTSAYPTCVVDKTTTDEWLIFEGEMIVENKENLGPLSPTRPGDVIRTIVSRLPFQVRYPTHVAISSDAVRVFAPINVIAAITGQDFVSGVPAPGIGQIVLFTSVQYPFKISGPVGIYADENKFVASASGSDDTQCTEGAGSVCYQSWFLNVQPFTNVCNLNGLYNFTFEFSCRGSEECPIQDEKGFIEFNLQSENFCAQVIDDIDLSGSFGVYEDAAFTTPKTAFLVGQDVHFRALMYSNKATITASRISRFDVNLWDGSVETLFDGSITSEGSLVEYSSNAGVDSTDASLVVKSSVFPVATDTNALVTFDVTVEVTYLNTEKKTFVFKSGSTQQFNLQTDITVSKDKSSGAVSMPSVSIFYCLLALFAFLF